jgi:uncharacterized damage-inducible protein DinB
MTTLGTHLLGMARNNAWANHRLAVACAALPDAERRAPRAAFFGSIHRTLAHILVVDRYYVDALVDGHSARPAEDAEDHVGSFDDLRAAQRACDRRLVAYCGGLSDAALESSIVLAGDAASPARRERVADVLPHLLQHQIHHRGQVHAMLAGTPVEPPQLDEFFCANEAHLRAAELAEIGLSEEIIWGKTQQASA